MPQYFTDWTEYPLNTLPSDWTNRGPAGYGIVREVSGERYLELTVSSTGRRLITWDAVDGDTNTADVDVYLVYRRPSSSAEYSAQAMMRMDQASVNDANGYLLGPRSTTTTTEYQRAAKYINGGNYTIISDTDAVTAADVWYAVRVQAIGTALKLKKWDYGSAEPTGWDVEVTDTTHAQNGFVGLFGFNASTTHVLQFGVGTNGDPAPTSEPTGGTDDLTANDISSTSQVSAPAIGQAHALSASDVSSLSSVTAPSVSQTHDLTPTDATSASAVTSPTISQTHGLTATDVQSTSQVSSPALAVQQNTDSLSANDISSASSVTDPALGQVHNLAANDAASTSETGSPALQQEHALTSVSLDSLSQVSSPSLTSVAGQDSLSANDVQATSTTSSPALGQVHALQPATVESTSETSQPAIGQVHTLTANDATAASGVSTPTLRDASQTLATPIKNTKAIAVTTTYKAAIIQTDYKAEVA